MNFLTNKKKIEIKLFIVLILVWGNIPVAIVSAATSLFEPYILYATNTPHAAGLGDFNHDGLTDTVVSNSSGNIEVFTQNNNGTLNTSVSYAAGLRPESLAVADLNNDNWDDIVVTNFTSNTISVFIQQANGTFAPRTTYATGNGPDSVAVGDINGDGLKDVAVSNWNSAFISIFIQNLGGTLNAKVDYAAPQAGYDDIAIGDVNGDGLNDVVKMNGQLFANPDLSVYHQAGGILQSAVSYSLPGNLLGHGIEIGDVTGDGKADVVMSYGGNIPNSFIAVFAQTVSGTLQTPVSYASYQVPEAVEIEDVNADGLLDVLVAHGGWNSITVHLQQNNSTLGTYTLYSLPSNSASHYKPQSLAVGDVNSDALTDILIANYNFGLNILYHASGPPIVTNTNDSGPGSLRKITADASNGETVTFAPYLAGETIHLVSPILIDKNIKIDGSSLSTHVNVSGDTNNDQTGDVVIFQIAGSAQVEINHLTITKGYGTGTTGGGGISNLGTLTIKNSIISSNTYINGIGGGGIYNKGVLTIIDSEISNNTAIEGGGVFNELNKTLIITRTTFSNNSTVSSGPAGGAAGAIANIGTVNIENSTFSNNQSQAGGGAIVNSLAGNASISTSSFTGNTTFGNGGAINNFEGTMTIGSSTFTNNVATNNDGGAISNAAQLTVNQSSFSMNHANSGGGGAIANSAIGNITINNSSISTNSSAYGAGIINSGITTINGTQISTNSATQGGGGILNGLDGVGTLSFNNGSISGNSAPYGAGVFNMSNSGNVSMANCAITGNTSTNSLSGHGGGISNFVQMTINNCTIANNSAPHYGGGILSTGALTIKNSTISNNSASNSGGIEFSGTLSLVNTIIANSTTGKDCFNSSGTVTQNINNLIEDNAVSPNQCSTPSLTSDPKLAALANNGGFTQTMALFPNSPAVNAGNNALCSGTDQRGITRPQGSYCDIGAFELTPTFSDTPMSHPYWLDIEILYANDFTGGCSASPLLFCPDTTMDRAQGAVFMLRGLVGTSYVPPIEPFTNPFGDSWAFGPWAQRWAQGMLDEGLTAGCSTSPLLYCPWEQMPRAQAAVFGMRLLNGSAYLPPAGTGTVFADVNGSEWYAGWAEQAYLNNLLPTCGTKSGKPLFCPNDLVSRGLGAHMIVRARNLSIP